jgi:hypothetical protein
LDLLAGSSGISEDEAASALDELLERRLVREQSGGSYDFSHDNIREVAYGGLGSTRRRLLHHRIAEAQIASTPGSRSAAAGIAKHLEHGGYLEEAIPYYKLAAEHALDLYATAEAVLHLDTAVELLKELPASAARLALEIDLRTALCAVLISVEGYSGPRILMEHARIQSLCDRSGVIPAPPLLRSFAHPLILRAALSELEALGSKSSWRSRLGAIPFSQSKRTTCLPWPRFGEASPRPPRGISRQGWRRTGPRTRESISRSTARTRPLSAGCGWVTRSR